MKIFREFPCLCASFAFLRETAVQQTYCSLLAIMISFTAFAQKKSHSIPLNDVERIVKTLSSDAMQGRATFTKGADSAASFIENEFSKAGLKPLPGESTLRQSFSMTRIKPVLLNVTINGKSIEKDKVVALTDRSTLNWENDTSIQHIRINKGENLFARYGAIKALNKNVVVTVDESFANEFRELHEYLSNGHLVNKINDSLAAVFILTTEAPQSYAVDLSNHIDTLPLYNVAGILPGRSKEKELVLFSAHYDHIGILPPLEGDSIANGADDDASGVTGVITLARHFSKLNNNERTLVFVAFTAEESGGFGSKYFSRKLHPEEIIAMFNMEMIGKVSKFGRNGAFISGYERSDFGEILQKNLVGTPYKFHPDPYPQLNLFYRSDNATLAALGVPAHTISTDQIDIDKFYHTVNDEFETLDLENLRSTIEAIALASRSIVGGKDTPKRIPPLEPHH